uniref:Uncharacterized protein n=1 Tax=Oryza glumipatula TaxID=40148 RepID=A0A0D9Z7S5_9ORYZ
MEDQVDVQHKEVLWLLQTQQIYEALQEPMACATTESSFGKAKPHRNKNNIANMCSMSLGYLILEIYGNSIEHFLHKGPRHLATLQPNTIHVFPGFLSTILLWII